MKNYRFILLLSFIIIAFSWHETLLANGGPVLDKALNSGNIVFINEKYIGIEKEHLYITFSPKKVKVSVIYTLKNYGDNERNITIAFPYAYKNLTPNQEENNKNPLIHARVLINGKDVGYSIVPEKLGNFNKSSISNFALPYIPNASDFLNTENLVFKLQAGPQEIITLGIAYECETMTIGTFSWSFKPDTFVSPLKYEYILATGGYWRRGVIKDFKAQVILNYCRPKDIMLTPSGFKKTDDTGVYLWEEKNMKPDRSISIFHLPPAMDIKHIGLLDNLIYFSRTFLQNSDGIQRKWVKKFFGETANNPDFTIEPYFSYYESDGISLSGLSYSMSRITLKNKTIKKLPLIFPYDDTILTLSKDNRSISLDKSSGQRLSSVFLVENKYGILTNKDLEIDIAYSFNGKPLNDIMIVDRFGTYIICDSHYKTLEEAKIKIKDLSQYGYRARSFWIPDMPQLSGRKLFEVYIGPYPTLDEGLAELKKYKRARNKKAYLLNLD